MRKVARGAGRSVVCDVCRTRRFVSLTRWYVIERGDSRPTCFPCGNAAKSRAEAELTPKYTVCRHCSQRNVNRPRGLCWSCYYTPGVKELYPSTSKYARRGVGNGSGPRPLPPAPTTAAPGTPEKVAVMERRAAARRAIFHPADSRWEGDPRPLEFLREQSERSAAA
jgi:hypothetical protein